MAQKVRHTSLQMDIPTIKFNSRTPSSSPALGQRSAPLIRQRSRSLCGLDEVHDQNNTPKRNKKCKFCHHYFLPFVDDAVYLFVCLFYCHCLLCTIIVFFLTRQCSLTTFVGRVCFIVTEGKPSPRFVDSSLFRR